MEDITWEQRLAEWGIPPEKIPNLAQSLRKIKANPIKHYNPRVLYNYVNKLVREQPWIGTAPWYDPIRWLMEWLLQTAGPWGRDAVFIMMGAFGYSTLTGIWKYLSLAPIVYAVYSIYKRLKELKWFE